MKIFHLEAFFMIFQTNWANFFLFELFFNEILNFSILNHSLFKSDLVFKTDFYHVHGRGGRGVSYVHDSIAPGEALQTASLMNSSGFSVKGG